MKERRLLNSSPTFCPPSQTLLEFVWPTYSITLALVIIACELAHTLHPFTFFDFAMPEPQKAAVLTAQNKQPKESSRSSFTPEQLAVLNKFLPVFLQVKRSPGKKLVGFWEPLYEALFTATPLKPLTDDEIADGLDQGSRKGERVALVKKVSGSIISRAE